MGTTREEIATWFDRGVDEGNAWMVVICDTFDHEDYPSYHTTEESAREVVKNPGKMQRVHGVYRLDLRFKDEQIALNYCWAFNTDWTLR